MEGRKRGKEVMKDIKGTGREGMRKILN